MFTVDHYGKDDGCNLARFKILRLIIILFLTHRISFWMPMGIREELRSPEYSPGNLASGGSTPQPSAWTLRFLRASPQASTDVPRLISPLTSNFKSSYLALLLPPAPKNGSHGPSEQGHFRSGELRPKEGGALHPLLPAPSFKGGQWKRTLCPLTSSDPFYLTLVLNLPDQVDPTGFSLPT